MADSVDKNVSEVDKEYRRKSISHMFKAALYGGIGAAAFFGLLNQFIGAAITTFSAAGAAAGAGAAGAAGAVLGLTPVGWLAVAGMLAVGVLGTYMSQIEATKLRELQDDGLAKKNADMLVKCDSIKHEHHVTEHEQNQRADGKCWKEVISQEAATEMRIH